jgi:PAS domain S-box-containing protein
MWEKIVLNLLSNAFKFTFNGEITVRLEARGEHAILTVADTGIGIPELELPHVFERFHRVESARGRNFEGSGIGLALIQEYAKLHEGVVQVSSSGEAGSTFTVTVPFGNSHLSQNCLVGAYTAGRGEAFIAEALTWLGSDLTRPAKQPQSRTGRSGILLADDNQDMREHLTRILGDAYDVRAVSDGMAALRAAREQKPDLILADIMMPVLDGIGMMQELRADPVLREIPIILISARAGEEARTEGISAGADDYLTKPFSARELVARVRTTLEHQRMRREARTAVETASARLQSALNAARMVAWEWDTSSGKLRYSANSPEVIGAPVEWDIDSGFAAVHPADVAAVRATVEDAIARRVPYTAQLRFCRPDNDDVLWMEAHGSVVSENPLRLGGVFVDITDRRRMDRALRESEERLSLAVDGAGMGTWDVDLSTGRSEWSNRHYEMLGYRDDPGDYATMEMWRSRVHPEDLPGVDARIEQARSTGRYASEHRIIRAGTGEILWLSEFGQFLRNEQGEPCRFVGVSFDVSGRKRAEQDLVRANRDLEQFAYSASHDLREPLRTVKIFSELLLGTSLEKLDPEARQFLHFICSAAARMDTLVHDLLAYVQAGTTETAGALQDAGAALNAALANLSGAIAESGAAVSTGALPLLPVHAAHLQQLFQNIIGYAIKFRRPAVLLAIRVSAERQNGCWRFSVADNGIGIDPEFQERIFGLFKRLHVREKYEGTGIGLALCQRIVESYRGRIWVESEAGQGSTFHFTLPA